MSIDNERLRHTVARTINSLAKVCPDLILTNLPLLRQLFDISKVHFDGDTFNIKLKFCNIWSTLFYAANGTNNKHNLNQYYSPIVKWQLKFLQSEDCLTNNLAGDVSNGINNITETCDHRSLVGEMNAVLMEVLSWINEFYNSPKFASANKELLEVYFNNYCALAQPLLVFLGPAITEQLVTQIVQLVQNIFNSYKKVLSGCLFILNGLIQAV